MSNLIDSVHNHLLSALPPAQWQRWKQDVELIELPLGLVLYESATDIRTNKQGKLPQKSADWQKPERAKS